MHRHEAGCRCREDVVVDAVTHIRGLPDFIAHELHHLLEEREIGLAHTKARRGRDDVRRQRGLARPGLEGFGLIADDAHSQPELADTLETVAGIRIQIFE